MFLRLSGVSYIRPLKVKVVFRPIRTLWQMLVHPKDPVLMEERKGVVYSISYERCSKVQSSKIGQTERCLKQRVREHRRALKKGLYKHPSWQACAGDWSCSASKQNGGSRPAPAYHHSVHAGELAHPVQPDILE